MSWYIENGRLTHAALPALIEPRFSPPYPPGVWYVENGRLTHSGLPSLLISGAFTGCSALTQVSIPRSVKSIGENSFAGTALRRVRIAQDCTYSETSFPEGCAVEFYE